MARIAFHLRITDGMRDEHRKKHKHVPDALKEAYLNAGAGLNTYSVFESDGHVFGFMDVDDPDIIKDVMIESEAQAEWAEEMEPVLENQENIWLDEVYRMI